MVFHLGVLIILKLSDGILSKGNCGHGMEKFSALITKLDSVFCVSISPIGVS